MASDPQKSIKEAYITKENISSKSQQWQNDIAVYAKNRARFKFVPSSSALLVMDMQHFFLNEESHAFIPSANVIVPNISKLLEHFRECSLPVIFTRHSLNENEEPGIMGRWWGDVIREGNPLSEIVPSISPLASEVVLRKTRYSAFHDTQLESILSQRNVRSVVITGVATHLCCETTAREAFMRDYDVFFVVDATATQNEELHVSSLKTLSHGFSVPITTNEILTKLRGV